MCGCLGDGAGSPLRCDYACSCEEVPSRGTQLVIHSKKDLLEAAELQNETVKRLRQSRRCQPDKQLHGLLYKERSLNPLFVRGGFKHMGVLIIKNSDCETHGNTALPLSRLMAPSKRTFSKAKVKHDGA